MKANIITDIAAGIRAVHEIREARKNGADGFIIQPVKQKPVYRCGGFYNTVEGCAIGGMHSLCSQEAIRKAQKAFNGLDPDVQDRFYFSPKDGEFVERARIFGEFLRPALDAKEYHQAMICIIRWYRHIKTLRLSNLRSVRRWEL